jgi:hypothetical protein
LGVENLKETQKKSEDDLISSESIGSREQALIEILCNKSQNFKNSFDEL